MSKKNLDRLFQEKFKDFDAKPDKHVWQNIKKQLEEEKNDKPVLIIPLWLKLSGVAVSILLMLFLGNSLFNTNIENQPIIVDSPQKTESNTTTKKPKSELNNKETNITTTVKNKNSVTESNLHKTESFNKKEPLNNQNTNNLTTSSVKSAVSAINNFETTSTKKQSTSNNKKAVLEDKLDQTGIAKSSNNTDNSKLPSNNLKGIQNNNLKLDSSKALAENSLEKNNLDKEEKEDQKENAIETAIAENEESNNEKEEDFNRWSIYANAAPVYYNSFGNGSSIDEQFMGNNKTGEINAAYGLKFGYAINEKVKIRTGINKLNLSYDTDDVIVYQNVSNNPKVMRNIRLNKINNLDINVISGNESFLQVPNIGFVRNVSLSQRISYFEVPLEVEYNLINKKISLNIIGGVSSFFLDDNELISEFEGDQTKIGEANNLNSVSFSTNFGVGLYYNFSRHLQLNLEPTFKYQINAYNNTSGEFNPYIIGLYSGLSYKF